ncbi:MAG: UDP-N-acetylglucosamine 2-epimerase [Candidatus Omnitrophota bacterium]
MIHIVLGTKAQYIKTAPLLRSLDKQNIPYNLIDTGQHAQFSKMLRQELEIREPDVYLKDKFDISTLWSAFIWFQKYLILATFCPGHILKNIFKDKKGICVIHGDTLSTVLSLFLAKRAGLRVAHIEAGLRSYNIFHPFPEEIIRIIAMKYSDILFAPSDWAYNNLIKMNLKSELVNMKVNTNMESTYFALSKDANFKLGVLDYCIVTIHRAETIFSKKKMKFIVNLLSEISKSRNVVFILHKPTTLSLRKFRLYEALSNSKNIKLLELLPHADFIHLLNKAGFIITDGGSIQEESFYLGKPCLILRYTTERHEGLGENVVISEFNKDKIYHFLNHYLEFSQNNGNIDNISASETIVKYLKQYA